MRISDWSSDVCSSDLIGDLLSEPADQPVARRRHRLRRHEQRTAETAVTKRRVAMLSGRTIVIGEHVAIRRACTAQQLAGKDVPVFRHGGIRQLDAPAAALDRKSTRLNSSHLCAHRMSSSAWKKKKK